MRTKGHILYGLIYIKHPEQAKSTEMENIIAVA